MKELLDKMNTGRRYWPYYLTYEYEGRWGEYIGGISTEETDVKKIEEEIIKQTQWQNAQILSLEVSPPRTLIYYENGIKIWWMPGERHYKRTYLRDQPPYLAVETSNYYGQKRYEKLDEDFVEAIIKLYLEKKFPFQSQPHPERQVAPPNTQ